MAAVCRREKNSSSRKRQVYEALRKEKRGLQRVTKTLEAVPKKRFAGKKNRHVNAPVVSG
jgi:hypothetical protein